MLCIKGVSYTYDKKTPVLDSLSLSLKEGQIGVLLGQNGVGKTTLLKLLGGLLNPQSGSALLEEEDLFALKPKERAKKIAYVPQEISFPPLTVEEVVLLGRLPYFSLFPSKEDFEERDKALRALGLENLRKKNVMELSGGERQKVMIAKALAQNARLWILDEPTSNLDIHNQIEVLSILSRLAKEEGVSILLSIHDRNRALRLGDRFYLFLDGKILEEGDVNILTSSAIERVYGVKATIQEINGERVALFGENK
jgi:iron complex transport system ATP-binding protein